MQINKDFTFDRMIKSTRKIANLATEEAERSGQSVTAVIPLMFASMGVAFQALEETLAETSPEALETHAKEYRQIAENFIKLMEKRIG